MSEPVPGTVLLSTGGTVRLEHRSPDAPTGGGDLVVILDHPDAPPDMRHTEAGRVIAGSFQPAAFAEFGLRPETLRAIATLIEEVTK